MVKNGRIEKIGNRLEQMPKVGAQIGTGVDTTKLNSLVNNVAVPSVPQGQQQQGLAQVAASNPNIPMNNGVGGLASLYGMNNTNYGILDGVQLI